MQNNENKKIVWDIIPPRQRRERLAVENMMQKKKNTLVRRPRRKRFLARSVSGVLHIGTAFVLILLMVVIPISPVFADEIKNIEISQKDDPSITKTQQEKPEGEISGLTSDAPEQESGDQDENESIGTAKEIISDETETDTATPGDEQQEGQKYLEIDTIDMSNTATSTQDEIISTVASTTDTFINSDEVDVSSVNATSTIEGTEKNFIEETASTTENDEESDDGNEEEIKTNKGIEEDIGLKETKKDEDGAIESEENFENDNKDEDVESIPSSNTLVTENNERVSTILPTEVIGEENTTTVPTPKPVDIEELRRQIREELRGELSLEIEKRIRKDCTTLEDGSYYCMKRVDYVQYESSVNSQRVFSAADEEGDDEIYLQDSGTTTQITNNTRDDRFPSYDAATENIVWQSLIDSRWQIMLYDTSATSILQLTSGDMNNMKPFLYNGTVVWQSWVDGNWEVMIASKDAGDSQLLGVDTASSTATSAPDMLPRVADGWTIKRITTNTWHDMFPRLAAEFVTWQAHTNGVWQVYMHDLAAGKTSLLSEGDSAYENPRFTIVWEKRSEDGLVEVIGYDFSTGETRDLAQRTPESTPKLPESPLDTEVPLPAQTSSATSTQVRDDDEPST